MIGWRVPPERLDGLLILFYSTDQSVDRRPVNTHLP